jgi:hypothetical protein
MIVARHSARGAEGTGGGGDAFIIGSDEDPGEVAGLGGALKDMLEDGFSRERG